MSTHDDFDINISQNEESELSEKEYSDILGLEGMAGGGETALEEETEEEKEEDSLVYVVAERHSQKQKMGYRRYTHEDETEERQEAEITIPENREYERKREDLSTNVSLDDNEQLEREEFITSIPIKSMKSNPSHSDYSETVVDKPFDVSIKNKEEQINHSELSVSDDIVQESTQIPTVEYRQYENKPEEASINEPFIEQDIDPFLSICLCVIEFLCVSLCVKCHSVS